MRVLFTTWAAPGHLYPMVPLAWGLEAAGHEVQVAAPPGCADAIARTGLRGVRVGHDAARGEMGRRPELRAWGRPARWPVGWSGDLDLLAPDQRAVVRALYEKQCVVADAMLPDLVALGRRWRPDVVVHDALSLAGPVVAAVLGVPAIGHGWETGSTLHTPTGDHDGEPLPDYEALFARWGRAPKEPVTWIDVCPPVMRPRDGRPVPRLDVGCVPYNGSGLAPDWLAAPRHRPRLLVTAGVAGVRYRDPGNPDVLSLTLRALADDVEVVLAPGAEVPADLPEGVRVVRDVPFRTLLPTCDLVVHHGGAGTAVTAALLGVPQVVLPPSPICSEIGHGVERAGVGTVLDRLDDTGLLLAAVEDVLASPPSSATDRLRAEHAGLPTPAAAAAELTGTRSW